MRILVINNGKLDDKIYHSILDDFIDVESIVFKYDIDEARVFIYNELLDNGKHIDLIMCNYDYGFNKENGRSFLIWLRSAGELYYSKKALRLKSMPVIIAHSINEANYLLDMGFDGSMLYHDIENNKKSKSIVLSSVERWINDIMNDYDRLGIDPAIRKGYYELGASLMVNIKAVDSCEVLSPIYNRRPYRLSVLSFQREIDNLERQIHLFQNEIVRISKLPTKRQEAEYHDALKFYKIMLLGDSYDYYWHETTFMYPDSDKSIRPDFIRRPYFYSDSGMLDIFEVKLPKERLLKSTEFHTPLSSKLFHSLAQVKDYQRYFKRNDTFEEVNKRLSTKPTGLSYTLLIGRDDEKNHFYDILNTRLLDFGSADIIVMTYDHLIRSREKMIKYRKLYRIR